MLSLAEYLGNLGKKLFSRAGEVKRVRTSISLVTTAFDVAAFLEVVDIGNDSAGSHAEISAEGALALTRLGSDRAHDSGVRRRQFHIQQLLSKQRGGAVTQLG